jgi:MFS family permease
MAVSPSVALAMLGCLIGGAGNGVYYVSVVQAVQERLPDEFQARVMGLLESVNAAGYGIGFLAGGAIAAVADPRLPFGLAAGGVLVAAFAIRMLLRNSAPAEPASTALAPAT